MTIAPPAVSFFVAGTPRTKGSLHPWHRWSANGKCQTGLSEQGGADLKDWRRRVAGRAARVMGMEQPFAGPVRVELLFYFPRPRQQQPLDRSNPYVATKSKWDIDKLQRAILDALTDAAVWQDDGQVADVHATKRYADEREPGALITVEALR